MIRTAVDTSLLVAVVLPWHKSDRIAFSALEDILSEEGAILVPLPAVVEAFAVLTRLPAPHRMSPQDACSILASLLSDTARIVGLDGSDTWAFLLESAAVQAAGGAIYDAQILACARKAGAERIFTLNWRDFERMRPKGLRIERPLS